MNKSNEKHRLIGLAIDAVLFAKNNHGRRQAHSISAIEAIAWKVLQVIEPYAKHHEHDRWVHFINNYVVERVRLQTPIEPVFDDFEIDEEKH